MGRKGRPKPATVTKTIDAEFVLGKRRKGALLREEVWQTEDGKVVKYNLAYIDHRICQVDNGRVLGYDNSHDGHHRHFMGSVEAVEFESYEKTLERFRSEFNELRRRRGEED